MDNNRQVITIKGHLVHAIITKDLVMAIFSHYKV